jgi:hypothetical protein
MHNFFFTTYNRVNKKIKKNQQKTKNKTIQTQSLIKIKIKIICT